jgi:hypothetical protein
VTVPELRTLARDLGRDHELMAGLVVADTRVGDERFRRRPRSVGCGADDDRDLVHTGVSWALRQIGKRSAPLNRLAAIETAREPSGRDNRGARWMGNDALRELRSPRVQARLAARDSGSRRARTTHG